MKRAIHQFKSWSLCLLFAYGLVLAGCKSSGQLSRAQRWGDSQVARGVKKTLDKDSKVQYRDVEAVVYQGDVQLVGFVSTPEARERASELATRSKGVQRVINCISIKPAPVVLEKTTAAPTAAPSEPPADAAPPGPAPDQSVSPNP